MARDNLFFIADQHLDSEASPKLTEMFFSFLDYVGQSRGELFILGDFFDYWANNRLVYEKNRHILQALQELVQQGCPVNMLSGNRDFLLKSGYLRKFGIRFLGEEHRLQSGGHKLLLTHGDLLFNHDRKYKRYRQIGWKILYLADLFAPAGLEHKAAMALRRQSQAQKPGRDICQVKPDEARLKRYFDTGCDTIICGHVHKSQIISCPQGRQIIILPAWENKSGGYGLFQKGAFTFYEFSL